jgi:valyl-tRNA synthetase
MIIASMEFVGLEKNSLTDKETSELSPFESVDFTGILQDKLGRKMSKSPGNSREQLDLMAKYGVDGLRFMILLSALRGQDLMCHEDNLKLGQIFGINYGMHCVSVISIFQRSRTRRYPWLT